MKTSSVWAPSIGRSVVPFGTVAKWKTYPVFTGRLGISLEGVKLVGEIPIIAGSIPARTAITCTVRKEGEQWKK